MNNFNSVIKPAITSLSRVFIAPSNSRCGVKYQYHSCMKAGGIEKGYGELTPDYCPDPNQAGRFIEVALLQGAESRPTTSLTGTLPLKQKSIIKKLSDQRCFFDLQIHFGFCSNPANFNEFDQAIILENARITNYSTSELGAMSPDENAKITETVNLSYNEAHYIYKLYYSHIGQDVISAGGNINYGQAQLCDAPNCYDCDGDSSDGCQTLLILDYDGTDYHLLISHDQGETWETEVIPDSTPFVAVTSGAKLICCGGDVYAVIQSDTEAGNYKLHRRNESNWEIVYDFDLTGYTLIGKDAYCINGDTLAIPFHDGVDSFIHLYDTTTNSEKIISTPINYDAFSVLNSNVWMIGGISTGIMYITYNGGKTWVQKTIPGFTGQIHSIFMKNDREWFVTTDYDYILFCTTNGGRDWNQTLFPNQELYDIKFSNNVIGYLSTDTYLYRTYDGGNSWSRQPDAGDVEQDDPVGALLLTQILVCEHDPNFVIFRGTSSGNNKVLLLGTPL